VGGGRGDTYLTAICFKTKKIPQRYNKTGFDLEEYVGIASYRRLSDDEVALRFTMFRCTVNQSFLYGAPTKIPLCDSE